MTTSDPPAPTPADTPSNPGTVTEPARQPSETPAAPLPTPVPAANAVADAAADVIRAEYAEIAAIAVQGGRLGVTVDAADAWIAGADHSPAQARLVAEARDGIVRALRAREKDAS